MQEVDILRRVFQGARENFVQNGDFPIVGYLLRLGQVIGVIDLRATTYDELKAVVLKVAKMVEEQGADGLIVVSEMWGAGYDSTDPVSATDSPNRREYLRATLIRAVGHELFLSAEIIRNAPGVSLGETRESTDSTSLIFAPIYAVWGRDVLTVRPTR